MFCPTHCYNNAGSHFIARQPTWRGSSGLLLLVHFALLVVSWFSTVLRGKETAWVDFGCALWVLATIRRGHKSCFVGDSQSAVSLLFKVFIITIFISVTFLSYFFFLFQGQCPQSLGPSSRRNSALANHRPRIYEEGCWKTIIIESWCIIIRTVTTVM